MEFYCVKYSINKKNIKNSKLSVKNYFMTQKIMRYFYLKFEIELNFMKFKI